MDIEDVAAKHPEKILTIAIDPASGLQGHHCRSVAYGLKLEGDQVKSAAKLLQGLYKAFNELDAPG